MGDRLGRLQQALTSRYRIERELGSGGMAVVFLAEDVRHRRRVALKVLRPELAAEVGPGRFLREIETAASLNHPHILPIHDSGEVGGFLYYVMPYVEGDSLRGRLAREKQLPLDDALLIAREVAGALSYAHGHGVVHRDIKPENILLQSGHAVVADFGIARAVTAAAGDARTATLTAAGTTLGTPAYMSPEQAANAREVDGRSDLYSLGCVLYEMLTGEPPFTGPTVESLLRQHLTSEARSITTLRPAVPEWVAAAVRRALAKTPADRFSPVSLFAEALAPREPGGFAAAPAPQARRRSRLVLLAGAVLAAGAIGALVVLRPSLHAPASTVPARARSEIAVLPFQNLSPEGPHAYFADGLHEELLTQLAKVSALKVISRTSVMGYQGTSKPLKAIANELGVGSVVEGSVQVEGKRLRVNVQLIDAGTDEHLWAERYDRTLDDAFTIQSEVAQKIVAAVGSALTSSEQARLAATPTANPEAYRLYLQGNEYLARPGFRRLDLESAQQLLEEALALDPDFALAHASLSLAHGRMYVNDLDASTARLALARKEAEAALRLAPDLPEAHAIMGWVHHWSGDYRRALDEFSIALRGLPNDALLWRGIGVAHRRLGEWTEVTAAFEKAARLNPRDADLFRLLGGPTYRYLRRYPDAVRAYQRALSLAPDVREPAIWIGWTYFDWRGQLDTLRAVLGGLPRDADLGDAGTVASQLADLLLYERSADSLLQMPELAHPGLVGSESTFEPSDLYLAWAHRLRGDDAAARAAFNSARVRLDSRLREFPDDVYGHYARGMALAGLGRRGEASREARWLQHSDIYREDAYLGPTLARYRAQILANIGESGAACDEIGRLLAEPSEMTVYDLRFNPLWDPIRDHPEFKALLVKYATRPAADLQ